MNKFQDVGIGMGNNIMGVEGENMGTKYLRKERVVIP